VAWTALLLAVLPGVAFTSQVGQVDHHVLEPLLVALPLLASLRLVDAPHLVRRAMGAGCCLGLGLFFWRGMILPAGLLAAAFGIGLLQRQGAARAGLARAGAVLYGTAALVSFPIAAASPTPEPFTYFMISYLQPLVFALCALSLGGIGCLTWKETAEDRSSPALPVQSGSSRLRSILPVLSVGILPWGLLLLPPLATIRENLLRGLGFMARAEPFVAMVGEQRPLLTGDDGAPTLAYALYFYGTLWLLLPLLGWAVWRRRERLLAGVRGRDWQGLVLGTWTVAMLFLMLAQRRYAAQATPLFAVWWGVGLGMLQPEWVAKGRFTQTLLAVGGTLCALPTIIMTLPLAYLPLQSPSLLQAMAGVKALTPAPLPVQSERSNVHSAIDYAILIPWEEGHQLLSLADRAPVGNPFGIEWFGPGIRQTARFWLAPDEELEQVMAEANARYALVSFRLGLLRDEALYLGLSPDDYAVKTPDGYRPGPKFARTAAARLFLDDGLQRGDQQALEGLRLVADLGLKQAADGPAARLGNRDGTDYKLFERVPGARLKGRGDPGERILLSVALKTASGRSLTWTREVQADAEGRWQSRCPYALDSPPPLTRAQEPVQARGRRTVTFVVQEQAVVRGLEVEADAP
jgi:asparagine N-glycosylation enzyme membrane subunit Stt3